MTRITRLLATSALVAMTALPAAGQDKGHFGIAMPTKSSAPWISDGDNMVKKFRKAGYETDLQYAEDDIPNQLAQIENMITKGVDVLVIAAIDGTTLASALANADAAGIEVVAYDRLIRDSENVDYYATFDNFQLGVQQANTLVEGLKARFPYVRPWNVELFGGSPDDNNAYFFYNGAMSVLQPMIEAGDVAIPSEQMGMDTVGALRWDGAVAQARMDNLLSANYTGRKIHGVLSPYDGLSIGIISSLDGVGYGSGDMPMPIVTGQDAEVPSVKAILRGDQDSTIFKNTRALAEVTVGMVDALLAGGKPEINDTETYDNGVKVVPAYLLEPVPVTEANWEEVLIDSGYYDPRPDRLSPPAPPNMAGATLLLNGGGFDRLAGFSSPARPFAAGAAMAAILEMQAITKEFPGVKALDGVTLSVEEGEIHALVGENGAGKSTLMKVLSGVYPHGSYSGRILFGGPEKRFHAIADSERDGIVIIHQELALVPLLSIAENIFLGNERARRGIIDWQETNRRAAELLAQVGLREHPETRVDDLGLGKRQLVEIAKALSKNVRLLILDEPTSSLNEQDSDKLLELLAEFRRRGVTSILISHKLNEIGRVADTVTVLRDGAAVARLDCAGGISEDEIIRHMVGRSLEDRYPPREPRLGEVAMEVRDWTGTHPQHADRLVVDRVGFHVRRGEVLGIAGLMGAGRTELAMSLFGRS